MKKIIKILVLLTIGKMFGATYFVSKEGGNVSPFTSIERAAVTIQAAVDMSAAGDTILVDSGIYKPAKAIRITKELTIRSIKGCEKTIIDGNNSNRCFHIKSGIRIDGFTITNGNTLFDGGGVYCECEGENMIMNCIIRGNIAGEGGGGVAFGIVSNCIISSNIAEDGGGVINCRVNNCLICKNKASCGGGAYNCLINNSIITKNFAKEMGGGLTCGSVKSSTISANASKNGGGFAYITANNCIIKENMSDSYGGGVFNSLVINSEIKRNSSKWGGGAYGGILNNCAVCNNTADFGGGTAFCNTNDCIIGLNLSKISDLR